MRYETIYEMDHLQMNTDYYNVLRYGTVQTLSTAKSLKVACKTLKLWTKSYSCFASHFTFRRFMYPEMIQWTQNIRGYVILNNSSASQRNSRAFFQNVGKDQKRSRTQPLHSRWKKLYASASKAFSDQIKSVGTTYLFLCLFIQKAIKLRGQICRGSHS